MIFLIVSRSQNLKKSFKSKNSLKIDDVINII
jgi:hypothetical protein